MTRLRQLAFALFNVVCMAACWPPSVCSRAAARFCMTRIWASGLLRVAGVRVYAQIDPQALPGGPRTPAVLVSNHASLLDIPILCRAFGWPPRFIAKLELGRVPLLAFYMRRTGAVLIDRTNAREAKRQLQSIAGTIAGAHPVCFFAEGTRSPDGRIRRFKKGAFDVAIQAGVPVVPAAIVGSDRALPPDRRLPVPADVVVRVGPALQIQPGETAAALAARVRAAVGALHAEAGGQGLAN